MDSRQQPCLFFVVELLRKQHITARTRMPKHGGAAAAALGLARLLAAVLLFFPADGLVQYSQELHNLGVRRLARQLLLAAEQPLQLAERDRAVGRHLAEHVLLRGVVHAELGEQRGQVGRGHGAGVVAVVLQG